MVNHLFKRGTSVTPRSSREIWEEFINDKELLKIHNVSEEEMRTLRTFAPLGRLSGVEDILFILGKIRWQQRQK